MAKIAISIDERPLDEMDRWVAAGDFSNRSEIVRAALIALQEQRARRASFLEELQKLDPLEEQALAEEFLPSETAWPAY